MMLYVIGPLWANTVIIVSWLTHDFRGGACRQNFLENFVYMKIVNLILKLEFGTVTVGIRARMLV